MAFTFGMRQAEMRGLTWDRVDLDGGLVRVDRWLWGVRLPSRRCELRRGSGGGDPRTIQEVFGRASYTTTASLCAHLQPAAARLASKQVSALLAQC